MRPPRLVDGVCPQAGAEFFSYADVSTPIAMPQGLAVEYFGAEEIARRDYLYSVVSAVRITKPSSEATSG